MRSSSNRYFSRLDHLRFVAALLVLFWHTVHVFVPTSYVPKWFPLSLLEEGHTGVALFMALSGFIFMSLCRDKEIAYGGFIRNRLLRIAPLFVFWLSLSLWTTPAIDLQRVLASLATMATPAGQMPGVGWTILVEFQFYLLFPFLLVFYRREGPRFLFGILAVAVATRLVVQMGTGQVRHMAYHSLFGRIDQFLLGMLACEARHRWPAFFRSRSLLAGSVVAWMLLVHWFNLRGGYDRMSNQGIWVILPTLEGAAYGLWTACWLSCPWTLPRWLDDGLAWMGKLSFSFYLNHILILKACVKLAESCGLTPKNFESAMLFTLLGVLPATTLLSALTFRFIEQPFLSLRKDYSAAAAPPAATAKLAA